MEQDFSTAAHRPRARDLGLGFEGTAGELNAITDVPGVEVGYQTIVSDVGVLDTAAGTSRTGVTAILPRGRSGIGSSCNAATFSFNGNGELTGRSWIDESGSLTMPIALTNSHAVGACHQGIDQWIHRHRPDLSSRWLLPVVGETWDGYLNDINGDHVTADHAGQAIDNAHSGPVEEGSVGGGTGMNCYGFKAGSGTASRQVDFGGQSYHLGVFIQANFGSRAELRLDGIALGKTSAAVNPLEDEEWLQIDDQRSQVPAGSGSAIIVVATDAPLLPGQCAALARRAPLGMARTGTTGGHFSGDIILAFSTANPGQLNSAIPTGQPQQLGQLEFLPWGQIDPLYKACVEAVEESIANALIAAEDMTGRDGHFSPALPHHEVLKAIRARNLASQE